MRPKFTGKRGLLIALGACLCLKQTAAQDVTADRADPVSTSLVIINGFLVFFMQVGFLAYETGSGRAKNVRNILLKNLLDVMLAALVWWAIGYAFAYGQSAKGVIGTNLFFYEGGFTSDKSTRPWFFSWTFCIAACTIISGCLAERTALAAYPVATLLISGLVHPLLVHWLWSPQGWMSNISECQVLDFAGGMVVHMLGGLFGLMGAWKCGPRLGRFELAESGDNGGTVDSASDLMCEENGLGAPGPFAADAGRLSWNQYLSVRSAVMAGSSSAAASSAHLPEVQHPSASAAAAAGDPGPSSSTSSSYPGLPGGARLVSSVTAPAVGTGVVKTLDVVGVAAVDPAAASADGQQATQHPGGLKSSLQHRWQHMKQLGSSKFAGAGNAAGHVLRRRGRQAGPCGVSQYVAKSMPGHDMAFVTLGTFMLWFGWFGFNNGSVYMYVSGTAVAGRVANTVSAEVVQRTSMNTALGGASGGLVALLVAALFTGTYDLRICCNGVLSGLVTVTCMCGFVDPWAAVVCSSIAGALYTGISQLLLRCGIDDPLDSSAVHLGNGLLGTILVAFFAKPEHVMALTGSPCGGVFFSSTGWLQLGLQLMGVAVVIALAGGCAWLMFVVLDRYGLLRVDQVTELAGIDNMDHGGPAYPEFTGSTCISAPAQNPASAGRRALQ